MLSWKNLIVSTGNAEDGTELGTLIAIDDSSLLSVQLENGKIHSWPQLYISAPGEEPDWNTPNVPVNWSGFSEALSGVHDRLGYKK